MAKTLDLDAIRPQAMTVTLGGKEYALRPRDLDNGERYVQLHEVLAGANDPAAQIRALRDVLAFIVPEAPPEAIGALSRAQQDKLLEFYAADAKEEQDEAQQVAADPTSPG